LIRKPAALLLTPVALLFLSHPAPGAPIKAGGRAVVSARLTHRTATKAFAGWIRQNYMEPVGIWRCPQEQVHFGRAACLGEFRSGRLWHNVAAWAEPRGSEISIIEPIEHSWRRRWTPYNRRVIRGFGLSGKASVNGAPAADWPFLALGAYSALRRRRSVKVIAYDGNSTGFHALVSFRCRRQHRLIKCRNRLGDAMRYRHG
jgi:hypothetical protein